MTKAVLAGILALLLLAPPAESSTPWAPASGYDVLFERGGDRSSGRVFQSRDVRKLLVVPHDLDKAFMLDLKARTLGVVARASVKADGGGVRLESDRLVQPAGAIIVRGAEIRFSHDGVSALIGPQDPLVGEVPLEVVLARKPDYVAAIKTYRPDPSAVAIFRKQEKPVELLIFFGTWCGTCKARLPGLIKSVESADNPRVRMRFMAVAENYAAPRDILSHHNVRITPSVLVFSGDREVGRVNRKPQVTLEMDVARILKDL